MGVWSCTQTAATSSTRSAGPLSYGTCPAPSTSPSCMDTPTTYPASPAPPAAPTSPLDRVLTWGSRCAPSAVCACWLLHPVSACLLCSLQADVIVWKFDEKELYCRFVLHKVKVQALAFSPSDLYLATLGGLDDGRLAPASLHLADGM